MHAYKIICPLCLYTCGNTGKPREAMWTRRHGTHACFDFSLSSSRALTCCFSLSLLFFNLVFEREPHAFFDNASTWLLVASKCAHMCTDIRGKGGRGCDTQRRTSTAANTAQSCSVCNVVGVANGRSESRIPFLKCLNRKNKRLC